MKPASELLAVKIAIAVALTTSLLVAVEMSWRIYGLSLVLGVEHRFPPISAEAMATKAAPMLLAAINADPIYRIVQNQHVDLHKKHEFIIDVAESAQVTAYLGVVLSLFSIVALMLALYRISKIKLPKT